MGPFLSLLGYACANAAGDIKALPDYTPTGVLIMAINDDFLSVQYAQKDLRGASKLPLSALRISPIPTAQDRESRLERPAVSARNKRARKRNTLAATRRLAGPGFQFDVDVDENNIQSTPETLVTDYDLDEEVVRKPAEEENTTVKRLAGFLLESGRAMNVRYNVVDPLDDKKETGPGASNKKQLQISRTTKNRKETVMGVLSLKYHWLAKCQEDYNSDDIKYPGVEGVYNPLQIIRNRAIRAKYHEPAPPLRYANLPLACNVFSSHKKAGGKPWRMLWGIELNELVNDEAWRSLHWKELRNPKGELWFSDSRPPPRSVISFDTPSKPPRPSRLHDKLWSDVDTEDRSSSRSKSPSAKSIRKNIRDKAKRLYGSASSAGDSNSDVDSSSNEPVKSSESLLKPKQSSKSDSDSNTGHIFQIPRNLESSGSSEAQRSQPELPKIKIDTNSVSKDDISSKHETLHLEESNGNRSKMNLDEVQITPLHSRSHLSSAQLVNSTESSKFPEVDSNEVKFMDAFAHERSLELQLILSESFMTAVFPRLIDTTSMKLNHILNKDINVLLHDIVLINDSQLPAHESFYTGFLSECKSLMHVINDEYAVKIDHLLSATDRSIGEINTSLSLDMKKVNENLDRVNQSLFGSIVPTSVSDRDVTFTDGGNYKILYFVLENAIVVLLRLTWFVVNIYKFILAILKIIWKLTSILFGI